MGSIVDYKTVLLTGLPRSGTTLTCFLLNKVNNVLALNEPLVPNEFDGNAGHAAAGKKILDFCIQTRASVLKEGRAISAHQDGIISDNTMARSSLFQYEMILNRGRVSNTK
jgi:hypothetical protein